MFHQVIDGDKGASFAAEKMLLEDLSGKLEAYERAHESEVGCMEQRLRAMKHQISKLEEQQGRKGKEGGDSRKWTLDLNEKDCVQNNERRNKEIHV